MNTKNIVIENINFWQHVSKDGQTLTSEQQLDFCTKLVNKLYTSPELAKIFFNTQVYNDISNNVTNRGSHSNGVAIVAENLAINKAKLEGKDEIEQKISGLLAKALGFMHDLGHTPFGHDGEGALSDEMQRFASTDSYKDKRRALFGDTYTQIVGDSTAGEMCYEHNETSAIISETILKNFAQAEGYDLSPKALEFIKTGILAHSTSRFPLEPKGAEQKALRLADKIAYIPQDLGDLIKQGVLNIGDLSADELSLLGLNINQFTTLEQAIIDSKPIEQQESIKLSIQKNKQFFITQLSKLDKLTPTMKLYFFDQLDSKIAGMQAEIATRCFPKDKDGNFLKSDDGEVILDGGKKTVDKYDRIVNKNATLGRNHTDIERLGEDLFRKMRIAQKMPLSTPEARKARTEAVNITSQEYQDFLVNQEGLDPVLASLWVTKAKYQDAFIKSELRRSDDGKSLDDMNEKHNHAWEIKTTFQYFYSNIEQIPEEFRKQYQQQVDGKFTEEGSKYTDQQVVSAFIASFTNYGFSQLYNGLISKGLVISRKQAIDTLLEVRPDLSKESLNRIENGLQCPNPNDPDKQLKISPVDALEIFYDHYVGEPIVVGKDKLPEDRQIPSHPQKNSVLASEKIVTNAVRPAQLDSAIRLSLKEVNSSDITKMVETALLIQKDMEIDVHIGTAKATLDNSSDGGIML